MVDGAMASAPRRSVTHGSITVVTNMRRDMMNKVWLVWKGEYSEKDVVAVAQTEAIAKAEALFDAMDKSKGGQNEVQVQGSESV